MCIYQIVRLETGESYIGQTINKVKKRWSAHCTIGSDCVRINRAIQKHGKDAFAFTVLEVCDTLDQLNEREEFLIKELNTMSPNGYNLMTGGNNSQPCEETRRLRSIGNTGKIQEKYELPNIK